MPVAKDGPVIVREHDVVMAQAVEGFRGLRIAQISDMHFSRWNRVYECAQRLLLSLEFDVLCVTGDFGDYRHLWQRSLELSERFLRPIVDRKPVYASLGNHDSPNIAEKMSLPVRWLRNSGVVVETGGAKVFLAGIDQNESRADDLDAALIEGVSSLPTVLMAHYPSTVFRLPDGPVDLVLSGHTHGGQIRLPVFGCIWPNDAIPRRMAQGLHRVGQTWLHVSSGLGTSLPLRARFLCPPEISVLRLVSVADHPIDRVSAAAVESRQISLPV